MQQSVNSYFTVSAASPTTVPEAVIDLETDQPTTTSLQLTWTAPHCSEGTVTSYQIRYSTTIIGNNDTNGATTWWATATQVTSPPLPDAAGRPQSITITGLSPNTVYYFALKSFDSNGNPSPISNSPCGRTFPDTPSGPPVVILQILPTSRQAVDPDVTVSYKVKASVSTGDNQGLATIGFDVETDTGKAQIAMQPGQDMDSFLMDANTAAGFTNPAGFGGAPDTAGNIRGIGGAQNTIGNDGISPHPAYPQGTPVTLLGQATDVVIATGQIVFPHREDVYTISLTNVVAGVLSNQSTGPTYPVVAPTILYAPGSFQVQTVFADRTPPAAVTNLSCSNITASSVQLNWTAPGDLQGSCTAYDIRYSTSPITPASFSSATQVAGAPAPASPGTNQNMVVSGLSSSTTYYFAIKTSDAVPNWSAISNVPNATTDAG